MGGKNTNWFCLAIILFLTAGSLCAEMGFEGMSGGSGRGMSGGSRGGMRGQEGSSRQAQSRQMNIDNNLRQILTYDKELNLTTVQVEAITGIRSELLKEAQQSFNDMALTQQELSQLLNKNIPDFEGARSKTKEIAEIAGHTQTLPINAYEKAYNLLNDDQKRQLIELRAKKTDIKEAMPDMGREGR